MQRDFAAECLFCDMASGATAVDKLYDDPQVFAIRDIYPRAPVHFLVMPKEHIATVADVEQRHGGLLARMIAVANDIARCERIAEEGYRLVVNAGE